MNTAIFAPVSSGSIGLGFAIPSNDIKVVANALRNGGALRTGALDFRIQQVTPELADALNMPKAQGVIVGGLKDGDGAANCGIVTGDIILRYGTMEVKDVRALARAIARDGHQPVGLAQRGTDGDRSDNQELPPLASPVPDPSSSAPPPRPERRGFRRGHLR